MNMKRRNKNETKRTLSEVSRERKFVGIIRNYIYIYRGIQRKESEFQGIIYIYITRLRPAPCAG